MPRPKRPSRHTRDWQLLNEIATLRRTLQRDGPQQPPDLLHLVSGEYWAPGRFERAVEAAIEEGQIARDDKGHLVAT